MAVRSARAADVPAELESSPEPVPPAIPGKAQRAGAKLAGLRPHQQQALRGVCSVWETAARAQVRAACGTGKTRIGVAAAAALAAAGTPVTVVVAVPTLALVAQTLREYREHMPAARLLAVCSDPSVTVPATEAADDDGGSVVADGATREEIDALVAGGITVALDPAEVAGFLAGTVAPAGPRKPAGSGVSVVVVTHVSSPVVQEAQGLASAPVHLLIVDEAHRTAGLMASAGRTALVGVRECGVRAERRLFMTATPRVHRAGKGEASLVASMDDEVLFGPVAFDLPFQQAVDSGLLAPYTVAVVAVTDEQWQSLAGLDPTVQSARAARVTPLVTARAVNRRIALDPATLASTAALLRSMHVHGLRTVVSFHSRVWRARVFADAVSVISSATNRPVDCFSVSSLSSSEQREEALGALRDPGEHPVLVTNARVLSEGVDVPALDAVLFADPRRSVVDVTQVVGRVMRTAAGKQRGVIVLPVVLPSEVLAMDAEELVTGSSFAPVWTLLRALADLDVSLAAQFDALRAGLASGRADGDAPLLPDRIAFDIPNGLPVGFMRAFTLKAVTSVASSWADGYAAMCKFAEQHGHCRAVAGTVVDGRKLDIWVSEQRTRYAQGLMRADRIEKLEGLPGWYWNVRQETWVETFELLKEFVDRHGRQPAQLEVWRGKQLGAWIGTQRMAFKSNRLPVEFREALEALPGWSWSPHEDAWEQNFTRLEEYARTFGAATPPPSYRSPDGFALGRWVYLSRSKRDSLDPVRRARLEAVPGWTWDPFRDRWEAAFAQLAEHAAVTGSARLPASKQARRSQDGFDLVGWVQRMRSEFKAGKLDPDQVARLEALPGWSWDPYRDQWEEAFTVLAEHAAVHGAARLPGSLRTPSGRALTPWVSRMRKEFREGRLAQELVQRLEAVPGWSWRSAAGR